MPNTAFILLITGVLLIYCELIWVGKIVFGTAGALLVLVSIAMFTRLPYSRVSVFLIASAIVCFVLQGIVRAYYIIGVVATASLAHGFSTLGVSPLLAYPVSIVLGAVTTALLSIAKRARQNKKRA